MRFVTETVRDIAAKFPVLAVLLLLNVIVVGAAVWYLNAINARNTELFRTVLAACLPT